MEKVDENQSGITETEILRVDIRKGSTDSLRDHVVTENHADVYINDAHYAILVFSPFQTKELIIGHLLTEKVISKLDEIASLEISEGKIDVHLTKQIRTGIQNAHRAFSTECQNETTKIPPLLFKKIWRFKNGPSFSLTPEIVLKATETLNSQAAVFRRTGGTHASALMDHHGRILAFSEDIGRRNAIDKVIGQAFVEKTAFEKTALSCTGRVTRDMVIKIASIGIPIIISMSAPTDKAIKIAQTIGLTLIGFARGKRFNVYSHPERIAKKS